MPNKKETTVVPQDDNATMSLDEASDIATMSEQSTDHEENESESELESEREEATSGSETEDSDDAMQDVPEKKRRRVRTTDNAADFAAGLDRVLSMSMNKQEIQASSHCRGCSSMRACVYLLAGSANPLFLVAPVMAKNRVVERRLEEERLERRARKVLTAERSAKRQQGRQRLAEPDEVARTLDYEKRLKKVATRGVIQLFNAIRAHQKTGEDALAPLVVATTKAKEKDILSVRDVYMCATIAGIHSICARAPVHCGGLGRRGPPHVAGIAAVAAIGAGERTTAARVRARRQWTRREAETERRGDGHAKTMIARSMAA
ncbi:Rrp15p-domain-containing protein [Syncephalis pseudoplumigaleata]|uniref:Rrp15p-domain-containing protein n=1 Tax=Syncephalis pseudoplumigaleata TaxID=1712513 RepID=A0A4P9YUX8_9FUNG|nr:Rrp15p-domain-containing protein [Syncephalis pseudoplumigaleata]|eukprot:RKP23578.1 Rrp15p-domain-containing protein [Syncephalis pseudoplumigaleata]